MRRLAQLILILIVLPILIGGVVLFVAGRPLAFQILQQRTAGKFPEVKWIPVEELASWRGDRTRPQPVLVDARTGPEFAVSHLDGAVPIDPYRPSLRTVAAFPKDTPIVVYSSAGYRGARVASWLGKAGFTKTLSLGGGVFAWANDGWPLFRDGRPAALVHPYDRRWGWLLAGQYRARSPDVEKRSAAP